MNIREAFEARTAGARPGIVFTGCDLVDAAVRARTRPAARGAGRLRSAGPRGRATGSGAERPRTGRRREVIVGGRRVKTIDVHAHCVIPEAHALLDRKSTRLNSSH